MALCFCDLKILLGSCKTAASKLNIEKHRDKTKKDEQQNKAAYFSNKKWPTVALRHCTSLPPSDIYKKTDWDHIFKWLS